MCRGSVAVSVALVERSPLRGAILCVADRPGDRWAAFARRPAGRKVRTPWATRLVTPGGRFFALRKQGEVLATDSATENKPPVSSTSVVLWRKNLQRT